MNKIFSIVRYTLKENIRNKIFYVLILFGVIILASSLLFGVLGGEQELRMIVDLGLSSIEILGLLTAIYSSVTLILEEMETKTVYLIISRPIKRYQYLLGRYLGVASAVGISIVIMAGGHLLLLWLKGWHFEIVYLVSLILIFEKILIVSALSLFFSLFSTSVVSSISFTFFFWILGHFLQEMKFLFMKLSQSLPFSLKGVYWFLYYLIPNFQYFNLRDQLLGQNYNLEVLLWSFVYGITYSAACLVLSTLLFSRKEF